MTVLVADVGGTNTRVALATTEQVNATTVTRFRNAEFASLSDVLNAFLRRHGGVSPMAACVAIAGPVRHGVGRLTNRDWIISEEDLMRVSGATKGLVINDLSAQGYALDCTDISPVDTRDATQPDREETRLVVGIGTGFNAAPVFRSGPGLLVTPSECGHVTLPVWDEASERVAAGLKARQGFASVEDVLSGRGLPQSYRLLTAQTPPDDPADILLRAAHNPDGPEGRTLAFVIGTLGRVIGDLSLTHLPFGGIILIGGMARAYLPLLETYGFRQAMTDKGRFSDFISNFRVFTMDDDYAALSGCANYARSFVRYGQR